MSCTGGVRFSMTWDPPWGGASQPDSAACGTGVVRTVGTVINGEIAVFADGTGTKVRKATAADLQTWLIWAASHVPIEGSALYQEVRYTEVEGEMLVERVGEPVAAPWG